jgi:PIN domain nuclease of toxin-antitoxin system
VRLLLDTQILLWAIYRPARIPPPIKALLADRDNELFLSDASVWEMAVKLAKGRLEYETVWTRLSSRIDAFGIRPLPIERTHIEQTVLRPHHHGDPFDRMLIAQALVEQLPLVSADEDIRRYDVRVIW